MNWTNNGKLNFIKIDLLCQRYLHVNENQLLTRRQCLQIMYLTKNLHPTYKKSLQNSKARRWTLWLINGQTKLNRHVSEEDIQIANSPWNTVQHHWSLGKWKLKALWDATTYLRMADDDIESLKLVAAGGENSTVVSFKTHISYDPEIPILGIYHREMKMCGLRKMYTWVF